MIDDLHPLIVCICYSNDPYLGRRPNKIFFFKVVHSSICSKHFVFVCSVSALRKLGEQAHTLKLTNTLRPSNGNDPGRKLCPCEGRTVFLELSRRLLGPDTPISSPAISEFFICSSSLFHCCTVQAAGPCTLSYICTMFSLSFLKCET